MGSTGTHRSAKAIRRFTTLSSFLLSAYYPYAAHILNSFLRAFFHFDILRVVCVIFQTASGPTAGTAIGTRAWKNVTGRTLVTRRANPTFLGMFTSLSTTHVQHTQAHVQLYERVCAGIINVCQKLTYKNCLCVCLSQCLSVCLCFFLYLYINIYVCVCLYACMCF